MVVARVPGHFYFIYSLSIKHRLYRFEKGHRIEVLARDRMTALSVKVD